MFCLSWNFSLSFCFSFESIAGTCERNIPHCLSRSTPGIRTRRITAMFWFAMVGLIAMKYHSSLGLRERIPGKCVDLFLKVLLLPATDTHQHQEATVLEFIAGFLWFFKILCTEINAGMWQKVKVLWMSDRFQKTWGEDYLISPIIKFMNPYD